MSVHHHRADWNISTTIGWIAMNSTQKKRTQEAAGKYRHLQLFSPKCLIRHVVSVYAMTPSSEKWRGRKSALSSLGGDSSACIEVYVSCVKAAFSQLTTRGRLFWLYRSLYNDSTSLLIYSLSKHCKHEIIVSISSFKSSSWEHYGHLE